jgi:hypothetical protein
LLELPDEAGEETADRNDMLATILFSLLATTAVNDEFQERCEAYQAEYGGGSDCTCLAEKYDEDDDLAAALDAIEGPEDLADAPEIVAEAVEDCS